MYVKKDLWIATSIALFYTTQVLSQSAVSSAIASTVVSATVVSAPVASAVPEPSFAIPNNKIAWKEKYPVGNSKPVPKPEWLALVKDDPALKFSPNILTADGMIQNSNPSGNNSYCNWTWGGCVKPTDIVSCKSNKVWGTSFDDGPYLITRDLLRYLKSINRKVTFFVIGKQVITWPEILKEAYDQGHEIGIHTWDHSELTTISNEMVIGELKWTELAIKEVLGITPRLMRPPRGDIDDRVRYIVEQLGYTPAMWSVDSQDWRITAGGQTEEGLLGNVTQWINGLSSLTQGGNSLMHDLNNVTVGAALKALPMLHSHIELVPIGVCAGWKDASYLENLDGHGAATPTAAYTGHPIVAAASPASNKHLNGSELLKAPTLYTLLLSIFVFISFLF